MCARLQLVNNKLFILTKPYFKRKIVFQIIEEKAFKLKIQIQAKGGGASELANNVTKTGI